MQVTDHDLAIDEILGATEGDEADFDHGPIKNKGASGQDARLGRKWVAVLLLADSRFNAGFLAFQVGDAAFLFDVFIELLSHKSGR
jgi:hypothetical protein